MSRALKAALALAAILAVCQIATLANGVSIPSSPSGAARALTPEEMARDAYNSGIGRRDRALRSEEQARKDKKESDRAKNDKKARDEYEKALKDFQRAVELDPKLPQAYNGIGFAYRKLGDYSKALDNYDRALALDPGFLDAIEYRGEACLGLNRIDEAKQAYLELFAKDRKQADALMKAMKTYVEKKTADPAGIDPAALSAFEAWIAGRAGIADATRAMGLTRDHATWPSSMQ